MGRRTFIIRNTARRKGRSVFVSPKNSPLKFLSCGRIILDSRRDMVSVNSKRQEAALICLKGEAIICSGSRTYTMRPYDAMYLPRGTQYEVTTSDQVDLVESSAPSDIKGEPQFVSFGSVQNDPSLHLRIGEESCSRDVYKLIDMNVKASRLLCGVTFGKPGNWTSWPPHEHAGSKEEVYLYINMPRPAFGIQMMYRDLKKVDFLEPVFEDDAVIVTKGFHPNVCIPGCGMNYVWMMAALNPVTDRAYAHMRSQEDFARKG